MIQQNIKKILIVGGGTAGWMAASSLSKFLQGSGTSIHVIESSEIGTVGVGEATIPTIVGFNQYLGLDEPDLMRRTQATFKLGIRFDDWAGAGTRFLHPFANYGVPFDGTPFHNFWMRARAAGDRTPMEDYCLPSVLARSDKFALPPPDNTNPLGDFGYAYQFDATLYAEYLREFAQEKGVQRTDARVVEVKVRDKDGFIESVLLDSGVRVEGDLFIDCSGFRSLLLGQCLGAGFEDWSHWLPANRALAVQTKSVSPPEPFTRSTTREAGWQWHIPLQHRVGNGYVYCSEFHEEDHARETLLNNVQGKVLGDPRLLSFQTGMRDVFWKKNCVALGLAAGFMEPLESTSIALIQSGIRLLQAFYPGDDFSQCDIDEANRQGRETWEQMRDFLILHYKLNRRTGDAFWDQCRAMDIPATLEHKLALFQSRAYLVEYGIEPFKEGSWLSMYAGFDVIPENYDRLANYIDEAELRESLGKMKNIISHAASLAPDHSRFLNDYCKVG